MELLKEIQISVTCLLDFSVNLRKILLLNSGLKNDKFRAQI